MGSVDVGSDRPKDHSVRVCNEETTMSPFTLDLK